MRQFGPGRAVSAPEPARRSRSDRRLLGDRGPLVHTAAQGRDVATITQPAQALMADSGFPAGHFTGTAIIFTGHGYRGVIGAATSLNMSGTSGLTGRSGNEAGITLAPI